MTLFPFATQATEQVPGASIEKPRVWVINLAAFQLIVSVDWNKQYKQQQAVPAVQKTHRAGTESTGRVPEQCKHANLAAFQLIVSVDRNEQYKQQ